MTNGAKLALNKITQSLTHSSGEMILLKFSGKQYVKGFWEVSTWFYANEYNYYIVKVTVAAKILMAKTCRAPKNIPINCVINVGFTVFSLNV